MINLRGCARTRHRLSGWDKFKMPENLFRAIHGEHRPRFREVYPLLQETSLNGFVPFLFFFFLSGERIHSSHCQNLSWDFRLFHNFKIILLCFLCFASFSFNFEMIMISILIFIHVISNSMLLIFVILNGIFDRYYIF